MAYTIEVEGLTRSFGGTSVLGGIDLRVAGGTVAALLGPNGAGKTTTVKILSTLLRPDAGRVRVAGYDVVASPKEVRRRISLTGQHATVDEVLTGRENLVMMGRLRHLTTAVARDRAQRLLERFDLVEAADRRVSTYSGGMARRLDIALGLVDDPLVLFLDEPTTGLDPRSRRDVWDTVAELAASGVTVLLTTQYLEEADRLADSISVLADGRIAASGTADSLKALVGGETVELVLPDAAALAAASALLPGAREEDLSLHVLTDGTATGVREVLEVVAGVPVLRVAVHRPTLDDVFLQLTEVSA